jgi:ABC-type branched-subunit amino acid transport system ATPase component/branched-subunit amino acid ABC-type transport system permease component
VSQYLTYIIAGLAGGAIYGLAGSGFVLTYKTSGIFNFAFPALATVAAYVFYFLHLDKIYLNIGLSWPVTVVIAVLILGPIMGLLMEVVGRWMAAVAVPIQVGTTIGLALGIQGAFGLFYQNANPNFAQFLPTSHFTVLRTGITWAQLILFLVGLVSVSGLYVFFRVSRLGSAMHAVVDNPELLGLTGTSPALVRRWAWVIGCTFAAAAGVLLGPTLGTLTPDGLFELVVASFGAAAIGGFSSLPLTFVGGLGIGILGSLGTKWEITYSWLAGLQAALPFIVLYVVLLVIDRRKLADRRVIRPRTFRRSYHAPWRVRMIAAVLIVTGLALAPVYASNDLTLWGEGLIYGIVVLSAGLAIKEAGLATLCQVSFAAVGGVAFAHLGGAGSGAGVGVHSLHLPFFLALLAAGVIAMALGAFVAIPAIRVSGVFLALATFGFGLAMQNLFWPTEFMFTASASGLIDIPRPSFAQGQDGFYFLTLAVLVFTGLIVVSIESGRLGRLLRGLADSPRALNTMGCPVNVVRVIVFSISAFFAGIAGALYGPMFQAIGLGTPLYQPVVSLQIFLLVVLVGLGAPWYGIVGGIALATFPGYLTHFVHILNITPYLSLILGVSAILVSFQADRRPIMPLPIQRFLERFRTTRELGELAGATRVRPEGAGLEIGGLVVRFGGTTALNGLSLSAPYGRITGLIGPNGAGKTTTFNACSGLLNPAEGEITYDGRDITSMGPAARARLGLGRTFQIIDLWDTLTVRDNIALGVEAPLSGQTPRAILVGTRGEQRDVAAATAEAAAFAGVTDLLDRQAGELSTGQRRLVEVARVLAGPFDLLLLDEPSAGLDRAESERLGQVLRNVVRERGTGILLVEHDVPLVREICDYIYVMDFGTKVFEGTPEEAVNSPIVQSAYLGTEGAQTAVEDGQLEPAPIVASAEPGDLG